MWILQNCSDHTVPKGELSLQVRDGGIGGTWIFQNQRGNQRAPDYGMTVKDCL